MKVNVFRTELHDAEDCKLGFFRQTGQFSRYFHFHMQAVALVNSIHVALDYYAQTTFIKSGRVKQVNVSDNYRPDIS